ncbi:hypothetical protein Cni_G29113 [Canna indica]|uniref:Uncharacterized protein n=1 Tax=Canna indica TaxID=4628 RepID=A0AAQ3QQY7_9LILI|nr:hypothetical protein Cni_G29113 [Canna indica]
MSNTAEDCGFFAVDCVVVCCCCPCLLVQVSVFLFIRLPRRIAVKSKQLVLQKLRKRLKQNAKEKAVFDLTEGHFWVDDRSSFLEAERLQLMEMMKGEDGSWIEANKVWEELIAEQGLFWFGSFWGITS